MLPLSATPVVGLPQLSGWSQVSENNHTGEARLFAAFAVLGSQAGNVGRDIADAITEQSINTGQELFDFITSQVDVYSEQGFEIYISASLITENACIFATYNGSVLLKRNKRVGLVLSSGKQLKIVEGTYKPEDMCVLCTKPADQFLSEIEQKLLQGYESDTIVTSIVPGIHALEDSSLCAVAFVGRQAGVIDHEAGRFVSSAVTVAEDDVLMPLGMDDAVIAKPNAVADDSEKSANAVAMVKKTVATSAQKGLGWLSRFFAWLISTLKSVFFWVKKGSVQSFVQKLPNFKRLFSKKELYITGSIQKKRLTIKVIGLVITICVIAGYALWQLYAFRQSQSAAKATAAPYYARVDQARTQFNSDPLAARQALSDMVSQLESELATDTSNAQRTKELTAVLNLAKVAQDDLSGQEELRDLTVFYDLRLVQSDFLASRASAYSAPSEDGAKSSFERAVFFDTQKQAIVVLDLLTKKVKYIALEGLGQIKDVKIQDSAVLILADGIYRISLPDLDTTDVTPTKVVEAGDSNKDATMLSTYDVYAYVFNPVKRNIYRYTGKDNEFSDPIGWLQSTLGVSFEEVHSMAVDGDVWLTTKGGEIKKYTRGKAEVFTINGLPNQFTSALLLTTTTTSENIYVLDATNSRIVTIAKKDGVFVREVTHQSLAAATDIFVSESQGKLFAVSGSIVFEMAL